MKLYVIAPTHDEQHTSCEVLRLLGWTTYDIRDVMRHFGIDIAAPADPTKKEQPSVAEVRRIAALEIMECDALVLHDELHTNEIYPWVQWAKMCGHRVVMLSTISGHQPTIGLLDDHNLAVIEDFQESAPLPSLGTVLQRAWRALVRRGHRFDAHVGPHMKNPNTRTVVYEEPKTLTTTN